MPALAGARSRYSIQIHVLTIFAYCCSRFQHAVARIIHIRKIVGNAVACRMARVISKRWFAEWLALSKSLYIFRLCSCVCLFVQKKTHFQYCHLLFFPPHEGQVTKAILKMRKNELGAKRIKAEWRIGVGERI